MKAIALICLVSMYSIHCKAQEAELTSFAKTLNFYIDFQLGRFDSLPVNNTNQIKYRKSVDDAFRQYVLHPASFYDARFVTVKDDAKTRFTRLDQRISVYITDFSSANDKYVVYSYTSGDKRNYMVKDKAGNKIVYEGNSQYAFVDNIHSLDSGHVLLVEQTGNFNTSRRAYVLVKTKPWKKTKSFRGEAFGQVPGEYFTKKFVKARESFQLDCEIDFTFSNPKDINKIFFDPATKILSYKRYSADKRYKVISATWKNGMFEIDDYNVNENLHENSTAVPY